MEKWERIVDRQIREAMEQGAFDNLPGKGKPLELDENPYEAPLAGTIRRIFRDNGVTHPLAEARQAIESEQADARKTFLRDRREDAFRARIHALNREIRLFNLRAPVATFHIYVIDIDAELETLRRS